MKIIRLSPVSGRHHSMDLDVTQEQIDTYNNGGLIQRCFPNLNADQREFIKTGITAEEWDEIHKGCEK